MAKGISGIESGDIKVYSTDESLDKLFKTFEKVVNKVMHQGEGGEESEEQVDLGEINNEKEEISPWIKNRLSEVSEDDKRDEDNNN